MRRGTFIVILLGIAITAWVLDSRPEPPRESLDEVLGVPILDSIVEFNPIVTHGAIDNGTMFLHCKQTPKVTCSYEGGVDSVEFIIIHSTANRQEAYDALGHASYQDTTTREVAWHVSVDESMIVFHYDIFNHVPALYHAGNRDYNKRSIGIEYCENVVPQSKPNPFGLNQYRSEQRKYRNLVKVTQAAKAFHPYAKIIRHGDIYGKNCPRIFDDEEWTMFLMDVNNSSLFGEE